MIQEISPDYGLLDACCEETNDSGIAYLIVLVEVHSQGIASIRCGAIVRFGVE
jgi:hypothetical protein